MDEHLGPADVAQELVSQAGATGRSLDQTGNIGNGE